MEVHGVAFELEGGDMVMLPCVVKDTMSAMVKLAEMSQWSSLDVIGYGMVSHLMTLPVRKCGEQCSLLVQLNAGRKFGVSLSRRKAATW